MPLQNLDPTPGADKWNAQGYPKLNAAIDKINEIDTDLTADEVIIADHESRLDTIENANWLTKGGTSSSNGLSLNFNVVSGAPYTVSSIVYEYYYTLFKKMCNLSFTLNYTVEDGAVIDEIQIPLPTGIVKNTDYRFIGHAQYRAPSGTTTICPLDVRIYKDGSEGQRFVLKRIDDTSITSNTGIAVVIEGSIHFITT